MTYKDARRVKGTSEEKGRHPAPGNSRKPLPPQAEGTQGVTLVEPADGGGHVAGAVAGGASTKPLPNYGSAGMGAYTPASLSCPAACCRDLPREGRSQVRQPPEARLPYRSDARAEDATGGSSRQGRSGRQPAIPSAGSFNLQGILKGRWILGA